MPPEHAPPFYYTDGTLTGDDCIAVSAGFRESPQVDSSVILFKFGEDWGYHSVKDDLIMSLSFCQHSRTLCGLGKNGLMRWVSSGAEPFSMDNVAGRFRSLEIKSDHRHGSLERVRVIGKHAYACGWGGQVYRVDGEHAVDIGPSNDNVNFLDINGSSEDCLYAVGLGGALWHFDGMTWNELDSPTNTHFYTIEVSANGAIWIGGAKGGLYHGSANTLQFIDADLDEGNVWSIAHFAEDLYISHGNRGLKRYDGQHFHDIAIDTPQPSVHRLTSSPTKLWSIGANDLAEFDNKHWLVIDCPENN